jgi:site-specific DNA-cytosine methylase
MNVLELFSGTGSVGKVCEMLDWNVVSVDMILPATHKCDIMEFNYKQYPKDHFDIVWASPPCTNYSKLQDCWIGRMRKGQIYTKEVQAQEMNNDDKLVLKVLEIIEYFNPHWWFIENPAGSRMKERPFMKNIHNYVVDYCMYSDWGYRKRTRIWTNRTDFTPLLCNKKCGNMIGNLHKTNLGNSERKLRTEGNGVSQHEAYRIPEKLILSLFSQ